MFRALSVSPSKSWRLVAWAALLGSLQGQAGAAAVSPKEITLRGPEVIKLDWNTRSLQAADFNADGKRDLLVINNDRSAIELLFQVEPGTPIEKTARIARPNRWEPVVEDARFRKSSITTGLTVYDAVSADFNSDGRIDIAYTGEPQTLTVRLQEKDGTWSERKVAEAPAPSQMVGSFRAGDLDGDGRADLAMLGTRELAVFFQEKGELFAAPDRYALPDESCYGLELVDVNGDKLRDLVYLCANSRDGLRVRLQAEKRQFGPEQAYAMKSSRCTLQILQPSGERKPAVFAFAQEATGQFEEFRLEPIPPSLKDETPVYRPRVFSPRPGSKTTASYALGDFDGDGQKDVAVSDPDGAQVFIYLRQQNGGFTRAQKYPVFADARAIAAADWDGDGRSELFVASLREQSVGVCEFSPEGRLSYPQPLPTTGRPLGLAAHREADGAVLLAVLREEKGKRTIELLRRKDQNAEIVKSIDLPAMKTDPRAVKIFDIDQDGRSDLLVLTALEPMRVFLQGDDFTFSDITPQPNFRRGLVDNLEVNALSIGNVGGDAKEELVVASGNFARALRVGDGGELVVVDQFNARDATAEVATAVVLPGDKKSSVLLYDRKTDAFQILQKNEQNLYSVTDTMPAGKIEVVGAEVLPGKNGAEAFIWGRDRFWWIPVGRGDLQTKTVVTHSTDLPEIHYSDVIAGDLTGDGLPEVVCVDPDKNTLEILSREADDRWESRLHFKVFETDEHFQGRKGPPQEPRETLIADVTGDGKNDLVLLVHDRVLVYPRE